MGGGYRQAWSWEGPCDRVATYLQGEEVHPRRHRSTHYQDKVQARNRQFNLQHQEHNSREQTNRGFGIESTLQPADSRSWQE